MILKRVVLNNIRSYKSQEIRFPESKILLAGDIGCGKSTILLAIEFALFGTLRGELSGNALLRNGSKTGSVDLEFELNKKTYLIHRSLKRGKTSVEQDAGYILENELKTELTPLELKAFIIDLLKYPSEYITKTKNLIYRFTVYTPQEDMKKILLEDPETRTSILRKVFNIDKYERIKSNSSSYIKFLREKQRAFEVVTKDLEEKKISLTEKKKDLEIAEKSLNELNPKIDKSNEELKNKESELNEMEKRIKEKNALSKIHAQNKVMIDEKKSQISKARKEIFDIEEYLKIDLKQSEDKSEQIKKCEKEIFNLENQLKDLLQDNAGINVLLKRSVDIIQKIKIIEKCPTCLQEVKDEHKDLINKEETEKQKELKEKDEKNKIKIKNFEEDLNKIKENLSSLRKLQQEHLINLQKKKMRDDKLLQKEKHSKSIETLSKEINSLELQQLAYEKALNDNKAEKEYEEIRSVYELLRKDNQKLLLEESTFKERISQINKYIQLLERDINSKLEANKKLENSKKILNWFTDYFIPLLDNIEKHVMAKVQQDFNDLFQQWFSVLVDDEMLQAVLDDSFTPLITQNGYDIEYGNLSGGERTACALAYRLALNKVVNDVFNESRTKDLLILDEPTDGFSEQQLDKMRDVLDQLNLKQILIVSHEPKMESFVDNVIKIQKQGHISRVL